MRSRRVSSQHEQNHEDNEELIKLLQTETTHIVKTNEQSLKQAKPILRTSSRRGDPVDDCYWQDVRQRLVSHSEHCTKHLDTDDGCTNVGTANGTNDILSLQSCFH